MLNTLLSVVTVFMVSLGDMMGTLEIPIACMIIWIGFPPPPKPGSAEAPAPGVPEAGAWLVCWSALTNSLAFLNTGKPGMNERSMVMAMMNFCASFKSVHIRAVLFEAWQTMASNV